MEDLINKLKSFNLGKDTTEMNAQVVVELWKEYSEDIEISLEILRALRGFLSRASAIEKEILFENNFYFFIEEFVTKTNAHLSEANTENIASMTGIFLQFWFNLIQGSTVLVSRVWMSLEKPVLRLFISSKVDKIIDYSSSIFLLVIKDSNIERTFEISPFLEAIETRNSSFSLLCVKEILKSYSEQTFSDEYVKLSVQKKFQVLEILQSFEETRGILCFRVLTDFFNRKSNAILVANSGNFIKSPDEAQELTLLLSTLASATSFGFEGDNSLCINAVYLLRMFHELGKTDPNFEPIRKLSEVTPEIESDGVFGFKRDLIRLIGNLCHLNRERQELVRSIDGIQLILDCSSMDGRNPFITQWVILAIRNLTENNPENQSIISNMEKSGVLDRKLIEKFGIIVR